MPLPKFGSGTTSDVSRERLRVPVVDPVASPRDRTSALREGISIRVRVDDIVRREPLLQDRERVHGGRSVEEAVDLAVGGSVDQVSACRPDRRREAVGVPLRVLPAELQIERLLKAGLPQPLKDAGELVDRPRIARPGRDADPGSRQDRGPHVQPEARVERPDAPQPVRIGALLKDRGQEVLAQLGRDAGVDGLELPRPGVVVEVGPVEVEDVGQTAVGRGDLHLPCVIAQGQRDQLDLHLPLGGVEGADLLAQRRRLRAHGGAVVKPGRDVRGSRPAELTVARGVGPAGLPTGGEGRHDEAADERDGGRADPPPPSEPPRRVAVHRLPCLFQELPDRARHQRRPLARPRKRNSWLRGGWPVYPLVSATAGIAAQSGQELRRPSGCDWQPCLPAHYPESERSAIGFSGTQPHRRRPSRCGRAGMRLTLASPPMGPDGSCQRDMDHAPYMYPD